MTSFNDSERVTIKKKSLAPLAQVGDWSVRSVPAEWEIVPGHGLRRVGPNVFPSNVVLSQEPLPEGITLREYIDNQIQVLRHWVSEPRIEGPSTMDMPGCTEAQSVRVAYQNEGKSVFQTQIYALVRNLVGIATFTTLENSAAEVKPAFTMIKDGLAFGQNADQV